MARGLLITLEGIDGAGKSTLAVGLRDALAAKGHNPQLLREPGGAPAAEAIRELVRDPAHRISDRTEALLFAAARAELVSERLVPLLSGGAVVLLDRFVDSSLVYQGAGRGLGIGAVREINRFATAGLVPDRTLLLALDRAQARARSRTRAGAPDRIEAEDDRFFARIADAYRALADAEPERFRTLDAGQSAAAVLADALVAISDLFDRITQDAGGGV